MSSKKDDKKKKEYVKPEMSSEDMVSFGAACNGTASGGRKESTGSPNFCSTKKLLS